MTNGLQKAQLFTDFNQFDAMKKNAKDDAGKALPQVAKQFEAIFLQSLLKGMRQANQFISKDNPLSSKNVEFFQDMLDTQMAVSLSNGEGIGLAATMVKQLSKYIPQPTTANTSPEKLAALSDNSQGLFQTQKLNQLVTEVKKAAKNTLSKEQQQFIQSLYPLAKKAGDKLGLDPKILLAQVALETGWGKHILSDDESKQSSHNLFNIKSINPQYGLLKNALEYTKGEIKSIASRFKTYDNYEQSFNDYVNFIQSNPRYKNAVNATNDARNYIKEIQQAGYATDPEYATKVIKIYEGGLLNNALISMGVQIWPT